MKKKNKSSNNRVKTTSCCSSSLSTSSSAMIGYYYGFLLCCFVMTSTMTTLTTTVIVVEAQQQQQQQEEKSSSSAASANQKEESRYVVTRLQKGKKKMNKGSGGGGIGIESLLFLFDDDNNNTNNNNNDNVRKQYWKETLDDIKNLTGGFHSTIGKQNFQQWKIALDDFAAAQNAAAKTYFDLSTTTSTSTSTTTTIQQEKENDNQVEKSNSTSTSTTNSDSSVSIFTTPVTTTQLPMNYENNDNLQLQQQEEEDDEDVLQFWKRRAKQRFEKFPSWELSLQGWYDEIQNYLEKVVVEKETTMTTTTTNNDNTGGGGYSMGNFGRPPSYSWSTTTATTSTNTTTSSSSSSTSLDNRTTTSDNIIPQQQQQQKQFIVKDVPHYLPASVSELQTQEVTIIDKNTTAASSASATTITKTTTTTTKLPSLPIPVPAKIGQAVLPHTDISDKTKRILIVTTASIPWRTGTAINPLLRAAYLVEGRSAVGGSVTLMIPWLERIEDQQRVYGKEQIFASPDDQTSYIRTWLRESANMRTAANELKIQWYTAWQNPIENSIYSMGDITALISGNDIDVCILEEPEHLNWYRAPGESWTKKFPHVVGILHTNYFSYALDQPAALIRAPAMRLLCSWMCRAHCHRIIKLSGTLDKMAPEKELVENVHGVRGTFLDVGKVVGQRILNTRKQITSSDDNSNDANKIKSVDPIFGADVEPKIYFIGKLLWSKGLDSLMELLKFAEENAGEYMKGITVDMYGGGPDKDAADSRAKKMGLDMPFHGPLDHAELAYTHKIFVNPSTSEVLCTTSAEALAMGKFVILPSHPSNDFFEQFPNCLAYASDEEFVGNLYYAMTHSPEPLTEEYLHALSWEAATERLIMAGSIPVTEHEQMKALIEANEAAIEIPLPPLVDNEKNLKNLRSVLQYTRLRYRQFRNRLSTEIQSTRVLPEPVRERLVAELDKRLDFDIDEVLASPKLRIKLSPAELDKQLLEFYDAISESPGGDVIRVVGGAGRIGLQNLYLKRQRQNITNSNSLLDDTINSLLPAFEDVRTDEKKRTASQWVRWSLRKNQLKLAQSIRLNLSAGTNKEQSKKKDKALEEDSSTKSTTTSSSKTTTSLMAKSYNSADSMTGLKMTYQSKSRVSWKNGNNMQIHGGLCAWNVGVTCRRKVSPHHRSAKFSILI